MWLILNVSDSGNWPRAVIGDQIMDPDLQRIPMNTRASIVYADRYKAFREAERLARNAPGSYFAVLSVEDVVTAVEMPWAVAPGSGKALSTVVVPKWVGANWA